MVTGMMCRAALPPAHGSRSVIFIPVKDMNGVCVPIAIMDHTVIGQKVNRSPLLVVMDAVLRSGYILMVSLPMLDHCIGLL